ncbi:MAG TPA: Holliday junction branch migration protein RuvA, partial [Phaeodactylibacter sp.]|nr:Holliday junction branch migration protein RuvA [Phaeodactylibacter sp.]
MIVFLKGLISYKSPTYIVIETAGGLGYRVHISLHTYSRIEKLEKVKLLTHLHVKEDSHSLYGFADEAERNIFKHLISVSGIGPTTAQVVLSTMTAEEVRAAILGEQVQAFQKVKGIGAKTAKRIILDLKDKMVKEGGAAPLPLSNPNNTLRDEALSALLALGFQKIKVQKTLNRILKEQNEISNVEGL